MGLLSRDQILTADDLPTRDVPVPEWGGTVRVRTLTGAERDAFEASLIVERGKSRTTNLANLRARLVAAACVDEHGEPLFRPIDIEPLGRKSSAALDRVFDAARELSGLKDGDVEDLTEGFTTAQSEPSTSA